MIDMGEYGAFLSILAGVTGGGAGVGGVAWYMLRGLVGDLKRQIETMTRRVQDLETRDIEALKNRMEAYETNCRGHQRELADRLRVLDQVVADEKNTIGWMKKLDAKLDRIAEANAASAQAISGQAVWLANIDAQHQTHVHDRNLHGGK